MSEHALNRYMIIEGEADVIAIASWDWSAHPVTGDTGTGAEVYDLSITREVDAASPRLLGLFETGTTVAKASLYEYSTAATTRTMTVQIGLTNMTVVNHRKVASSPGSSLESFGLRFTQSVVRYLPLKSDPDRLN